jgi:hypothetical protein
MAFIISVETQGRSTELFQVVSADTVLDLKKRYCAKHSLNLEKVTAYTGETLMKDTDTLSMFTIITMKVEGARLVLNEAAISSTSHSHSMAARLKPWSADQGKPKGFLGIF